MFQNKAKNLAGMAVQLGMVVGVTALVSACGSSNNNSSDSSDSSAPASSSSVSSSSSQVVSSSSVAADPCAGALFCDDFESGNLNAWNASGNTEISTSVSYSGRTSVQVKGNGGGYNRNFLSLDLSGLGDASTSLYGRMMVYLDDENSRGGDFTFVQADGAPKAVSGAPSSVNVMYRMRLDGRHDHIFANYDTYPDWGTDCWAHPPGFSDSTPPANDYLMPKNEWACVEWHFDAVADEMMFWRDGTELSGINVSQTGDGCVSNAQQGNWYAPQEFSVLHLGIEQYHNTSQSRTMYIDDVQVSDRYIGCD